MEEGAVLAAICKARSLNDPSSLYRKYDITKRRHDNYGTTEITLAAREYRASCREKKLTLPLGFFAPAPPYHTRATVFCIPVGFRGFSRLGVAHTRSSQATLPYRTIWYPTLP